MNTAINPEKPKCIELPVLMMLKAKVGNRKLKNNIYIIKRLGYSVESVHNALQHSKLHKDKRHSLHR